MEECKFKFSYVFKSGILDSDIAGIHIKRLLNFVVGKTGLTYEFNKVKAEGDYKAFFIYPSINSSLLYYQQYALEINCVSGFFESKQLKDDCMEFCNTNFPLYTQVELIEESLVKISSNPSWLIVLVRGTINDDLIIKDVSDLLSQGLQSSDEETRHWALTAISENQAYVRELFDEISRVEKEEKSELVRGAAIQLIENFNQVK